MFCFVLWTLLGTFCNSSSPTIISVKFTKTNDSFDGLRRFVGQVHGRFVPEHVDDIPEIHVHSDSLNRRERDEIGIWNRVYLFPPFNGSAVNIEHDIDPKHACTIHVNPRSLFLNIPLVHAIGEEEMWKQKRLVIGVPTSSKRIPFVTEQPVISMLIPSLLKSLTKQELKDWQITVMIAFDEGDYFFDNPHFLEIIKHLLFQQSSHIRLELYRHPVRNRVLYLWNWMYAQAMTRNYTHFYQSNDDHYIYGHGWLTAFHRAVNLQGGIAFPFDSKKFACSLPCQIFIGNQHWSRFGFLFPLEIKDWHGDTFMGLLYQNSSFCHSAFNGYNGRPGRRQYRYFPCRHVDFHRLLKHYNDNLFDRGQ